MSLHCTPIIDRPLKRPKDCSCTEQQQACFPGSKPRERTHTPACALHNSFIDSFSLSLSLSLCACRLAFFFFVKTRQERGTGKNQKPKPIHPSIQQSNKQTRARLTDAREASAPVSPRLSTLQHESNSTWSTPTSIDSWVECSISIDRSTSCVACLVPNETTTRTLQQDGVESHYLDVDASSASGRPDSLR